MSKTAPLFIEDANLSRAWAKAFLAVYTPGITRIAPLVVTTTGLMDGRPTEDGLIRQALDCTLQENGQFTCQTVASTLFPQSLWNPNKPREELFQRYLRLRTRLRQMEPSNRRGLYFERLIAYGPEQKNQLDHVITTYLCGNHRPTALQASLFIPKYDHTHQRRLGFPCMQHLALSVINRGELAITAFYASQYVFERAYGNYLGLCHLGHFMAHEMGLRLTQMTCVAAVAMRGNITKWALRDLLAELERVIQDPSCAADPL